MTDDLPVPLLETMPLCDTLGFREVSAGALCAFAHLPRHATGTATIESKTNFLRGVTGGTVRATATPLHVGTTTIVVETAVHDDRGRLVAKVTQTQAVLAPRAP